MSHTYNISLSSLKNSLKVKPDRLPMITQTDESFSKFKVVNTGQVFYYSNYDNGLYNENKELLIAKADTTNYDVVISETRSRVKSNKPYWIRILLGHACNYSCEYCMQKDIGNPDEREKITTTEYFIEQLGKLDWSRVQKVDLWGGETLLYWKTIVEIINVFDRENVEWYFPTNGTPLQMKHVEFFRSLKGKVSIGISHDGPGHARLRGEEFLHKKIDVLKALQESPNVQFSFNPVLSHTNCDLFDINNFFYRFCRDNGLDTKKIGISWTLGHNHDYENTQNSALHVIHGDQLEVFKYQLKHYLRMCSEQKFQGKDHSLMNNSLYDGGIGVLPYVKTLRQQVLPTIMTSCGVDDEGVLSVDMKGNVRTCPHTDESFIGGHLEQLDQVKLKRVDLDRYEKHCSTCSVFRLCKSNCPIEVPDEVFYTNCAVEKVYHRAVQNEAFKLLFNSDILIVE
jgi:uncharacterized protein